MDSGVRSFSSMHIQNRETSQPVRPIITSEHIEHSGLISILQLFLNLELFFKKVCETSPSPSKFSGRIKKMLLNFKSDNFTSISTIVPSHFDFKKEKPSAILCKVLEDFKTCTEIPSEKRPDSLFLPEFTTKVLFSQLISTRFSDIMDLLQFKTNPNIIAIDVVYDVPPTCEKVLSLLANLTSYKNLDISGFISAHGFFYSAFVKTLEQWRCFSDGKFYNWVNLVWSFCTSCSYPVLIVLVNGAKSSNFLSKIDLDTMQRFCKLQDTRVKISYVEEISEKLDFRRDEELYREYSSGYLKKETRKNEEKASEGEEKKPFWADIGKNMKNDAEKKEDSHGYIRNVQDYCVNDLGNRPRNFSTEPFSQTKLLEEQGVRPRGEDLRFKEDLLYKSYRLSNNNSSQLRFKEDNTYRQTSKESTESKFQSRPKQDYLYTNTKYESVDSKFQNRPKQDYLNTNNKNESIDSKFQNRPKQDYLNTNNKNESVETEKPAKSGILKNSSVDSKYRLQAVSPLTSPKNTLKEPDRFEEENTEKPYSILKNSWLEKKEPSEKKVNFSNVVFEIDDSVKGQMPEIKFASGRYKSPEYKSSPLEVQRVSVYRPAESITASKLKDNDKDSWLCPKCNKGIANSSYECGSCRFINWDKFYSLKSSRARAESIPTRNPEPDFSKTYRPVYESRTGNESWRGERVYDKYSDNIGRMTSRDFNYIGKV